MLSFDIYKFNTPRKDNKLYSSRRGFFIAKRAAEGVGGGPAEAPAFRGGGAAAAARATFRAKILEQIVFQE
ncbi:hypothetical protein B0D78_04095 [Pyramidobacter sp. C12-8]|nr:hypothetical protein B0D78_04095 [Pyramidobacter sp. C12-8]